MRRRAICNQNVRCQVDFLYLNRAVKHGYCSCQTVILTCALNWYIIFNISIFQNADEVVNVNNTNNLCSQTTKYIHETLPITSWFALRRRNISVSTGKNYTKGTLGLSSYHSFLLEHLDTAKLKSNGREEYLL